MENFRKKTLTVGLTLFYLVGILSSVYMIHPAQGSIIWSDGFESGSTVAWDYVAGTVDVNTDHVYTGTYSANITSTVGSQNHYVNHDPGSPYPTVAFFSCHYYFDALSLPSETYPNLAQLEIMDLGTDGLKGIILSIYKTPFSATGYAWRINYIDAYVYTWDDGEPTYNGALEPTAGNWYGLEMSWNHSAPNTGTAVWVNGTNILNVINNDPYSTQVEYMDLGAWSYHGSNAYTFRSYFDDGVYGDAYLGCPGVGAPGADTTDPEFLDGNPYLETNTLDWNTSLAGEYCSVSVNATDNVALSGYFLSYTTDENATVWTNQTWTPTSGTNKKIISNFTVPVPTVDAWVIHAVFYANDTANNWGVSLGLWPETYLTVGPVFNGSQLNTLFPTGYGAGNKAGSRRVFHGTTYWVAFYEESQYIYAVTSRDGYTWTEQGTANSDPTGDLQSTSDTTAWAPYVWGTSIYLVYCNGTFSASLNQTHAFYRTGIIGANGTITWSGRSNLVYLFRSIISAQWPSPGGSNIIFGYWSFSWTKSLDSSGLWLGFRVTGGFSGEYSRIFFGWIPAFGGLSPSSLAFLSDSGTYYDTEPFSVVTDPSFNTGFLLVYNSHDDTYVHYARYTGTAWLKVHYPEVDAYTYYLGVTTDWSTCYVPTLDRTYWSGKNVGTFYFSDVPDYTARFIDGGPLVTHSQINIGHTTTDVHIVSSDGGVLYVYTKNGPTPPGWVEGASWTGATVRVKCLNNMTGLSATEDAGIQEKIGLLWGNISEYWSSYDVLFGSWGSPRFLTELNVDMEGCGNWVFANDRYYNFNLSVWHSSNVSLIDAVMLRFSSLTRDGMVANTFLYRNDNWTLTFSPSNTSRNPTRLATGNTTITAAWDREYFNFRIFFAPDSLDIWRDNCVDIETYVNDTEGFSTGWVMTGPDYFKVYAQGGFILNSTVTGDAGVLDTATPFSFYAQNNSYVYRDLIYRDLVHVKMLPRISAIVARQTFYISFGMDYCLPTYDWVEGWKVILGAVSVTTGSILYFNWSLSWWNRGAFIKQEYIQSFPHTNVPRGWYTSSVDYGVTTSLWVDLWFDRQNASMVGGGRVNAYEYGMRDGVEPWLSLLTSNWGPIENQTKESENLFPILDGDDVTEIPASQIKMVKVWSSLEVASYTTNQTVVISDFPVWDLTFSNPFPPLTGIQTPYFDETGYPTLPTGGLLGSLVSSMSSGLKWISENILYGELSIWPTFVAFLDTLAGWIGFPNLFSGFFSWLGSAWGGLSSSLTWIGAPFVSGFEFLSIFMVQLITLVVWGFTYIGQTISGVFGFFTGTSAGAVELWNNLNLGQWVILGLIIYPIYLVMLWDTDGLDAVEHELRRDWWVLSTIFGVLLNLARFIMDMIGHVIESIPVIE